MSTKGFLIISVVANLALVGTVGYLVTKQEAAPVSAALNTLVTTQEVAKIPAPLKRNPDQVETNVAIPQINWRMVESEDYRQYIVNLRSIGCPEETIRDIITADVNKLFEARKKEMTGSTNKFQYWKVGTFFTDMFNEEKLKKNRELTKEKNALLKELLGVEVAE